MLGNFGDEDALVSDGGALVVREAATTSGLLARLFSKDGMVNDRDR